MPLNVLNLKIVNLHNIFIEKKSHFADTDYMNVCFMSAIISNLIHFLCLFFFFFFLFTNKMFGSLWLLNFSVMHELMSLTFLYQELCSISVITTNYEYLRKLAICKLR